MNIREFDSSRRSHYNQTGAADLRSVRKTATETVFHGIHINCSGSFSYGRQRESRNL